MRWLANSQHYIPFLPSAKLIDCQHQPTMSHLPFMTVESKHDNYLTDGTLDPDVLRSSGDKTASGVSSTSATSNFSTIMTGNAPPSRTSKRLFPVAAIASLGLSAVLLEYVPQLTGYELATVSRRLHEPSWILALVGWRVFEIGVAWFGGLDCKTADPRISKFSRTRY